MNLLNQNHQTSAINGAIIPETLVELAVSPNEATPAKMTNKA